MIPPIQRVLTTLTSITSHDPSRNGNGWKTRCPAHDDQDPSLSISEGYDGRVLLHCHAGCRMEDILSSSGLKLRDLMPDGPGGAEGTGRGSEPRKVKTGAGRPLRNPAPDPPPRPLAAAPPGRVFASPSEAVAELEEQCGPSSACWEYLDGHYEVMGLILRWDLRNGRKEIRPVSRRPSGWVIGAMPEPRPLYHLPELGDAQRVYVCEGEKAADALRALGLVATTSSGGCKAAAKTDWAPLAGKECIILPDNDEAGGRYAKDVVDLLNKGAPSAHC